MLGSKNVNAAYRQRKDVYIGCTSSCSRPQPAAPLFTARSAESRHRQPRSILLGRGSALDVRRFAYSRPSRSSHQNSLMRTDVEQLLGAQSAVNSPPVALSPTAAGFISLVCLHACSCSVCESAGRGRPCGAHCSTETRQPRFHRSGSTAVHCSVTSICFFVLPVLYFTADFFSPLIPMTL